MDPPSHAWSLRFEDGRPVVAGGEAGSGELELDLPAHGIGGILLANRPGRWRAALERFARPWPEPGREDRERAQAVEELRRLRFDPPVRSDPRLRVSVPNWPNTYEDSLWTDLFQNEIHLVLEAEGRAPAELGILSVDGLVEGPLAEEARLWPGTATPWIALRPLLQDQGLDAARLRLETRRQGEPFYSFVVAEVADPPGGDADVLRYDIALDRDWSALDFLIRLD